MLPNSGTTVDRRPTISRSLSLTIHAVPFGNTDVKVATIDRRVTLADGVGVRPLADDAARREPRARAFEELAREERGHAGNPRIRWLGDDHVVLLAREQQVRSSVADDQPCARIGERPVILGVEEARRLDHLGRNLDDIRAPIGWLSAAPSVTPLPRPTMATLRGSGAAAAAGARRSFCVSMSLRFDA